MVEREEDRIASLLWYDDTGEKGAAPPLWVNKRALCLAVIATLDRCRHESCTGSALIVLQE